MTGAPVEIRTEHLPNASPEICRDTSLLDPD
jgi:hypothetical protein